MKLEPAAKQEMRALTDMVMKTKDFADVEDLSEREDEEGA